MTEQTAAQAGWRLPLEATDIMRILPHRYPFLMVDRIVELEPGRRAVGLKSVTANEPQFTGHFPDRPIMPGVLIVEALAQTAGIAVVTMGGYQGKLGLFAGIDECRFRRMALPGDTLRLEVTVEKLRGMFGRLRGVASVDGEVAAEAVLSIIFPKDAAAGGTDA
ncbi:MAG TPA: 3-hydroxyacyl-ACP dehydratase FabZ [candidate division Zixibacteria bacterium]|nr:3-hydroxyacyl-ACP dehydratase FabZ [candidate division Zixibacteria bacterium]